MEKKVFKITVEETLAREIEVEAYDVDDAITIVKSQYRNGDIVLDADDFVDVEYLVQDKDIQEPSFN